MEDIPEHKFACVGCGYSIFSSYTDGIHHFKSDSRHGIELAKIRQKCGTDGEEEAIGRLLSAVIIPNEATIERLKLLARLEIAGPAPRSEQLGGGSLLQVGIYNNVRLPSRSPPPRPQS